MRTGSRIITGAALAAALFVAGVQAQPVPAPAPAAPVAVDPAAPPIRLRGYFTPQTAPDISRIIAPAPVEGDARDQRDRAIFLATRALEGTDRWRMAASDDLLPMSNMMANFSCAMGAEITPAKAPILAMLLARVGTDSGLANANAKNVFRRQRPFLRDAGNICVAHRDRLALSLDYPSGHASYGWALGLILAELAPDRSVPILARARAFAESRAVCGMHNASSVEAGREAGAAVVAALHGNDEFRADMDRARAELAALRAAVTAPDAAACAAETALVNAPAYPL